MMKKSLLKTAIGGVLVMATSYGNGVLTANDSEMANMGECHGINSCKGQGACGGKGHSCAGKNSCKGQGWVKKTKEECTKLKGTFKEG